MSVMVGGLESTAAAALRRSRVPSDGGGVGNVSLESAITSFGMGGGGLFGGAAMGTGGLGGGGDRIGGGEGKEGGGGGEGGKGGSG